jgi:hypothetical protein
MEGNASAGKLESVQDGRGISGIQIRSGCNENIPRDGEPTNRTARIRSKNAAD